MKAASYNKSEIMSQAWAMYRSSFYGFSTFADALKMAWYYAKQDAERIKRVEEHKAAQAMSDAQRQTVHVETKKEKLYKEFGKSIARQYRNVTFGKNDWRVSYGCRYY